MKINLQSIANDVCKKYSVKNVLIKTTNNQLKGNGYYMTQKTKGGKINMPGYIMIAEWDSVKNYPDEWVHTLSHELSHHIINMKDNSLQHTNKHSKLTKEIENYLSKKVNIKKVDRVEKKRLKDKIDYWIKNKKEIEKSHKEAGMKIDVEKEIIKMKKKLKSM